MCRIAGPDSRPGRERQSRSACARPRLPPATSTTGPSAGSSNRRRASSRGVGRDVVGIGRPTTRYFAPSRPWTGYASSTRRANGAASRLREPEMRVRLGHRRRDPPQPGGEHHRPGDVAARAEHDVRVAGARGSARMPPEPRQRARAPEQRRPGPPREARDRGRRRTRSRAQERAAPRRDPATRRTSPSRRGRAAPPPPRAPGRRARPSPRPRSGTAAVCALP